ncbi:integrator complex subunit 2-domain-containing protein [Cladochytrium replicatum]|nr:integrator complex subunit 2-domain-containing protein [Cladochytrium replicatum]
MNIPARLIEGADIELVKGTNYETYIVALSKFVELREALSTFVAPKKVAAAAMYWDACDFDVMNVENVKPEIVEQMGDGDPAATFFKLLPHDQLWLFTFLVNRIVIDNEYRKNTTESRWICDVMGRLASAQPFVTAALASCILDCGGVDIEKLLKPFLAPAFRSFVVVLLVNNPQCIQKGAQFLCISMTDQTTLGEWLMLLCKSAPQYSLAIRESLLTAHKCLPVCLSLTSLYVHDEVLFLNRFFGKYLSRIQANMSEIVQPLAECKKAVMISDTKSISDACSRLRIACIMVSIFGSSATKSAPDSNKQNQQIFGHEDVISVQGLLDQFRNQLLDAQDAQSAAAAKSERFTHLALCSIILFAEEMSNFGPQEKLIHWLKVLLVDSQDPTGVALMCLVYLFTNQLTEVCNIMRSILKCPIPFPNKTLTFLKLLVSPQLVSREKLLAKALAFQPQASGASLESSISVASANIVEQLLRGKFYSPSDSRVRDWVYRQIMNPMASYRSLANIIDIYIENSTTQISSELVEKGLTDGTSTILTLPWKNLLALMDAPTSTPTWEQMFSRAWMLFYLLQFNVATLKNSSVEREPYPDSILYKIDVRSLLDFCFTERNGLLESIHGRLIALLSSEVPELLNQETGFETVEGCTSTARNYRQIKTQTIFGTLRPTPETIYQLLQKCLQDAEKADEALRYLLHLEPSKLVRYGPAIIDGLLPAALQAGIRPSLPYGLTELWQKLNEFVPVPLWVETTRLLLPHSQHYGINNNLGIDDILEDPLILLKCRPEVFRSVPIYSIFLQMMGRFLLASPNALRRRFQRATAKNQINAEFTEQNLSAMLYAQDLSVMQFVLSVCERRDGDELDILQSIRSLTCSFLHQMFVEQELRAKLLHFQTYSVELLPVTVKQIPSMHFCIGFIDEMLKLTNKEVHIFALKLASQLWARYPLASTYELTRSIIYPQIRTKLAPLISYSRLLKEWIVSSEPDAVSKDVSLARPSAPVPPPSLLEDTQYFLEVVNMVVPFCRTFPELSDMGVRILLDANPETNFGPLSECSKSIGCALLSIQQPQIHD